MMRLTAPVSLLSLFTPPAPRRIGRAAADRATIRAGAGVLGAAFLCLLAATGAHAQVTLFSDRAAFTAASTGLTTIDFEGEVPDNTYFFFPDNTVTRGGVEFSSTDDLLAIHPDYDFTLDFGTGTTLATQGDLPGVSLVTFLPEGTTAVGVDFGDFYGSDFTIALSTGDSFTLTGGAPLESAAGGFRFAGFTSSAPLTFISFSSNAPTANNISFYDNFAVGAAATPDNTAAPEPGSLALLLPILGAVCVARRQRNRRG